MFDVLKRISIQKAVDVALIICLLLMSGLATLGWLNQKAADRQIEVVNRVGVNQSDYAQTGNRQLLKAMLSGINAVDMLNHAEAVKAATYLQDMQTDIARAEEFFMLFKAMPALDSQAAQNVVRNFEAEFAQVLGSMRQAGALIQNNKLNEFDTLRRNTLHEQLNKLGSTMEALFEHFNGSSRADMERYVADVQFFITVGVFFIIASICVLMIVRFGLRYLVVHPLAVAVSQLDNLAQANLTQSIRVESGNEVGQLQESMLHLQENLTRIVNNVREASAEMLSCSHQISSGNADLSARTEHQASSLEQTAASMEELTATVKQNADNARQAMGLAAHASDAATQGRTVVNDVIQTMRAIADTSKQVTQITNVIDSIAFQTNILALNASVEAARAGEQGRGFAVVASEVRNLASRSADAAREIKSLIDTSGQQIDKGADLVEHAGKIMTDVVGSVQRVSDIFDEIAAASQEQSQGIGQINLAVTQLDQVTQQNSTLVQHVMRDSGAMMEQANRLDSAVAVFQLK